MKAINIRFADEEHLKLQEARSKKAREAVTKCQPKLKALSDKGFITELLITGNATKAYFSGT